MYALRKVTIGQWMFNNIIGFHFSCIIVFFFSSCANKNDLKRYMQAKCVWDIFYTSESDQTIRYCFQFTSSGKCYYLAYEFQNKKRTDSVYIARGSDYFPASDTWNLEGDSILNLQGKRLGILRYTTDSVFLEGDLGLILVKNCNTKVASNIDELK